MSDVFTYTLQSDIVLTVPIQADFGEIILSTIFLALLVVLILDFTFVLVHRQ